MNSARCRKWGAISGARCGPGPSQWRWTTLTSDRSAARATRASSSTDGVAAAHCRYSCWPDEMPATASAGVTILIDVGVYAAASGLGVACGPAVCLEPVLRLFSSRLATVHPRSRPDRREPPMPRSRVLIVVVAVLVAIGIGGYIVYDQVLRGDSAAALGLPASS